MTTESLPAGVLGTPPEPHRSALVDRERVRHNVPLSQLRTVALGVSGMAAALGALSVVGMFGLPIDALTPVCWCIAGCQGFGASKSAVEHISRVFGKGPG